ncbi:MAG: glycosyl hydrolase family 28-related protein [Bradyrhizobium sp.]|uniref:phage tailspike polysaccharide lyase family protein n=1 Tax=Bradyrhizobium sp. TaxID=376 RepID=UPI003D10C2FE
MTDQIKMIEIAGISSEPRSERRDFFRTVIGAAAVAMPTMALVARGAPRQVEAGPTDPRPDSDQHASVDSSTVSFVQPGAGATARSAQAKLREMLSPYDYGAIGDGVADDTAMLQRAVSAATAQGKILDLGFGTYKVTGSIAASADTRIVNSGAAVIVVASGAYRADGGVLVISATATQVQDLGRDVAAGATAIASATTTSFAAGDLGIIYNSSPRSYSRFRADYHAGEFIEIASAWGTSLTLRSALYAAYRAASVDVYKITPVGGYIKDIIIDGSSGYAASLIRIDYGRAFSIERPNLKNANNDCIAISRSFGCTVLDPTIVNAGDGGDDYGIVFAGCQHCKVVGGNVYARRHAVMTGGAGLVNEVPNRDIVIMGATLKNDRASGAHCADFHGNTESCGFDNCTIFGGYSPQGRDNWLRNSRVYSMASGVCVYGAQILGGLHTITGNTFIIHADPSASGRGVIDFGGNSDVITADTILPTTVTVRDNTFVSTALSAISSIVALRNNGSSAKMNMEVADNRLNVNSFGQVLYMEVVTGAAASDYIIVERNSTGITGKYALRPDNDYSVLPVLRMPTESWQQSVNTSTSASSASAASHAFKWVYPRVPVCMVSRGSHGHSDNRLGVPYFKVLSERACRLSIATDDATNFSAVRAITLGATVGINEV